MNKQYKELIIALLTEFAGHVTSMGLVYNKEQEKLEEIKLAINIIKYI